MSMITEEAVFKHLKALEHTQESIETVALWVLHHKDSAEVIATVWLSLFRTVSEKQRLALIFLTNDVCQKARRKHYDMLRVAFKTRIAEAITYIRDDEKLSSQFLRIFNIWEERDIYEKHFLQQLRNSINMTFDEATEDVDEKLLLDFEPAALVNDLQKYQQIENSIDRARQLLTSAQFDFKAKMRSLKDREEGKNVLKDVDETCRKMSDFVTALEDQLQQRHKLIALLEQARSFFGQQLRDATVVEDAYRKFGNGIQNVKDQLEDMQRTGVYLGMSPPRDAPSPTAGDDPFAQGVEQAIKESKRPGNRDLIESLDMELDEDEKIGAVGANNLSLEGDMNLKVNQSFLQNPVNAQMLNAAGFSRKVDPRIERMQREGPRQSGQVDANKTNRRRSGGGGTMPWNGNQLPSPSSIPPINIPPPRGPWSPNSVPPGPLFTPVSTFGMARPPFGMDFSIPPPNTFGGSPPSTGPTPLLQTNRVSSPQEHDAVLRDAPANGPPVKGANRRNLTVLSGGNR